MDDGAPGTPRSAEDGHGGDERRLHAEVGTSPAVGRDPRGTVSWYPRFLLLEASLALVLLAALGAASLVLDAPLLAIADPAETPDPSKAPWYFVGLQELLHYYHPAIAGAMVPALVLLLLLSVPWTGGRPGTGSPLWPEGAAVGPRLMWIGGAWATLATAAAAAAAHPPWVVLAPSAAVVAAMVAPAALGRRGPWTRWLADRSLAAWIGLWLATVVLTLTLVGALFRGPGWTWVWPWIGGVY